MPKILIDSNCRILYASFYIQGMYDILKKNNVSFSSKYFKKLDQHNDPLAFDQYMAFVIKNGNKYTKVIIDFWDKSDINEKAYHWCDSYAKVNFNQDVIKEEFKHKTFAIPTGFGIRIWNFPQTVYYSVSNYFKVGFKPLIKIKTYFGGYKRQLERSGIKDYINSEKTKDNFIFLIGTVWFQEDCIKNTNIRRKEFVVICKKKKCEFEGGFNCALDHPQFDLFKDVLLENRYSTKEYIDNTKKTILVFNTPAVWNCHGWKLSEYLAMGKAIISTPFVNSLPIEMKHGEDIHFVNSTAELESAIDLLLNDKIYRAKLEKKSKEYWDKYVSPQAVIKYILNKYEL